MPRCWGRVARALGVSEPAEGDPRIASLKTTVAAIVEAAGKTGTLDEAALAELPKAIADRLRAAWADRSS